MYAFCIEKISVRYQLFPMFETFILRIRSVSYKLIGISVISGILTSIFDTLQCSTHVVQEKPNKKSQFTSFDV